MRVHGDEDEEETLPYWGEKEDWRGGILGPGSLELEFESAEEAVEDGEDSQAGQPQRRRNTSSR
jgi:hypothetical protein